MSTRRIERLLTQASTALEAGVVPLNLLANTAQTELRPRELAILRRSTQTGVAFADVVEQLGWLEPHEAAILRAGELGGTLDVALRGVVASVTRRRKARAAFVAMLAYPSGLLVAASFLGPLPRIVHGGVGAWLAAAWPLASLVVAFWVVLLVLWPLVPTGHGVRIGLGRVADSIPGLGGLRRKRSQARALRVLAHALGAGIGLREAIGLALQSGGAAMSHVTAPRLVRDAERAGLSGALGTARLLEPWQLAIVANAEKTGTLPASLDRLAQDLDDAADATARTLVIACTVGVFLAVAGWIGLSVVRGFSDVLREVDQAIELQMR